MISDRLLDLMVGKLVFLTPSVSVSESRDRRVAQMFSTTFRSEYHNYSEFLQKESRERGLEHSARHATRAKPPLFCRPDPNLPFWSIRAKRPLFVNPTQTSSVCQPDPNLSCLSTRPKPLLLVDPTQTSPFLSIRPKPPLFVDPNQPSFDPLSYYGYYWIIDICLPRQSLKFAPRIRLIRVILVIRGRDGVSCLVKKSEMGKHFGYRFYSSEVNLHLYFYLRRSRIMLHPGFPKML